MGQTLSEPITTKESASCANKVFSVGSSCMQGWRTTMEDAHTHLLSLPDDPNTAFFAVYDGHGGAKVSQYAGIHLHKNIVQQQEYKDGDIEGALKKGFLGMDDKMRADEEMKDDGSGTTAVVVLVQRDTVYCGNVGDSRAVLSECGKAIPLSYDHKPDNEEEQRRIIAAGGFVDCKRVNGNLALSRALGDFGFKNNQNLPPEKQLVTAFPDVIRENIQDDHEFIVLACDGIWDVMSNQEVIDFCRDRLAAGREPQIICEELLTRCLAPDAQMQGLGCDNMTVVLVCLLRGLEEKDFVEKCSRPSRYQPTKNPGFHDQNEPPVVVLANVPNPQSPSPMETDRPSAQTEVVAEVPSADPASDTLSSPSDYHTPQPSPHPTQIEEDERPPTEFHA
ncbi:unnamed protein product, partial [Mesorhabditis belari]|uniref:protein-serine/threonine phosphatase n=1 Tax=Mesorhabditis belari TaxID=2138241 RepID=A0AAF3EAG0_9BILA